MKTILAFIKSHIVLASTLVILVVASTAIAGRIASSRKTADTSLTNERKVQLVPASTFRTGSSMVSADGIVESVAQVDLKSQLSAPISRVNVKVGDTVYAGQVLVELQNADIRAQLDQARASLKVSEGQYLTTGITLESARKSTIDKIKDSYIKVDDAVRTQVDPLIFSNTISGEPQLSTLIVDSGLDSKIRNERVAMTVSLRDWKTIVDTLTTSSNDNSIDSSLSLSEKNVQAAITLLDDLSQAVNEASRSASGANVSIITGWKATVTAARNSVSGAAASLTAAESSLASARINRDSPAEAQVSVARAGVENLEAQLAKTIIRSPIAGKVAALPLRTGELASPGQLIATVVGSGGLQVKAYVSGEDLGNIERGAHATVRNTVQGLVTAIAPSVNQTNKKVEVNISILNPATSGLVVGDTVQVKIDTKQNTVSAPSDLYLLPMQNVKIVPGNAYVLTVDENSKIHTNSVVLGEVQGDFVEVKSGLNDDMKIVSPVYELNDGETVRVAN